MKTWKRIDLAFHSIGLDNEICFCDASLEEGLYELFLENKPNRISISFCVDETPEYQYINGVKYKRVD